MIYPGPQPGGTPDSGYSDSEIDDLLADKADAADVYTQAEVDALIAGVGGGSGFILPGGRLTLVTATPVMTTDQSAKTTLYYTPDQHNKCPVYNGSGWDILSSAEISLSLSGYTAGAVYDIFGYSSGGTLTLESTAWTNPTTRATALVRQDGVWVKTGALTRTYLGTIEIGATGECNWILGGLGAGGVAAKLGVWNAYNRVEVSATIQETADSWTHSAATWRAANDSATFRANFVIGLPGHKVDAVYDGHCTASAPNYAAIGIGLDSVTAKTGNSSLCQVGAVVAPLSARASVYPGIGAHYLAGLEKGAGASTQTFYGDVGLPGHAQSGLIVTGFF